MEFKSIEESNGMITEEKGNQIEINEIEQNKVRLMRAHVEREDSSVKEVDDLMIRRFLRARELDIEKASTLFLKHKPYKGSLEEFKGFVAYTLERICARMPAGQEKFVSIADLKGWGYANSDIRGYLAALSILQDCYPERLGKLFIVHVPYIFMTAWKVVYPFIDSKTKRKIIFVENKKLKSTLLDDIDESQLPDVYGGKLSLVPIQDD
ncbi:BINDING PROTEIN putative-RELATED [Salix purpurea]|uniref:BINDING PROTEIN putative-RELATED n=1 Tax=Salix purpurea TaxID=77065 RepID=A0A9Q0TK20_SALPP|nr:BINDING PROTEIN putative-RELATED [Salix purpurea]